MKALLVAEGSGGHLIPAFEVARRLVGAGARVKVWYAQRDQTASLVRALTEAQTEAVVDVDPIPIDSTAHSLGRLWQCGQLWSRAQHCFDTFAPDVVVGFGGWISTPIMLAAKQRRIGCLLHEQNVVLGRANRWLAPWVDRIAVSFPETQAGLNGASSVMTGMPVRKTIGHVLRSHAAQQFGFRTDGPTLLVLGGSQGSRVINRLMERVAAQLSAKERQTWQFLHITGSADEARIRGAYAACQLTSWVAPFLAQMDAAYALADVVIARAGASTIAELARCGTPAILIPYPYAGGHQRANAQVVQDLGGGLMLEESDMTPARVVDAIRRILTDTRLRAMMGRQMRMLDISDAAERLSKTILQLSSHGH